MSVPKCQKLFLNKHWRRFPRSSKSFHNAHYWTNSQTLLQLFDHKKPYRVFAKSFEIYIVISIVMVPADYFNWRDVYQSLQTKWENYNTSVHVLSLQLPSQAPRKKNTVNCNRQRHNCIGKIFYCKRWTFSSISSMVYCIVPLRSYVPYCTVYRYQKFQRKV
jgi:hypothetical protein